MTKQQHNEMMFLYGQIAAAGFFADTGGMSALLESIQGQYEKILEDLKE